MTEHTLELMDENSDAYRAADRLLPRFCNPNGDPDIINAANEIVWWDGKPIRAAALHSIDGAKDYLVAAWAKLGILQSSYAHEAAWAAIERAKGRPESDLTFRNCVRETGVELADGRLDPSRGTLVPPPGKWPERPSRLHVVVTGEELRASQARRAKSKLN